jgi:hypothetical protein
MFISEPSKIKTCSMYRFHANPTLWFVVQHLGVWMQCQKFNPIRACGGIIFFVETLSLCSGWVPVSVLGRPAHYRHGFVCTAGRIQGGEVESTVLLAGQQLEVDQWQWLIVMSKRCCACSVDSGPSHPLLRANATCPLVRSCSGLKRCLVTTIQ